jgi:hypothetical protein
MGLRASLDHSIKNQFKYCLKFQKGPSKCFQKSKMSWHRNCILTSYDKIHFICIDSNLLWGSSERKGKTYTNPEPYSYVRRSNMKRCWNCFKIKPESEFYVRRYLGKVGFQTRCKACNSEVVAAWRERSIRREIQKKFDELHQKPMPRV